jgi:hypothetical protein
MLPPIITVTAGDSHQTASRDPRIVLFPRFLAVSCPGMCQGQRFQVSKQKLFRNNSTWCFDVTKQLRNCFVQIT